MLIAPFVNVVSYVILMSTLIIAAVGQQSEYTKTIIRDFTAWIFPFLLVLGFCTSSGIYMIISLFDKEKKMRQYMFLSGVGPFSYYLGLYAADFLLFLITMSVFGGSVFLFQLKIYQSQMLEFLCLMISFGAVLIPFTYLFQHWFKNSDSAFRLIGLYYLLLGLLVPGLLTIIFSIATASATGKISTGANIARGLCFFFDPFFTFYEGVRNLIVVYISEKLFPDNQPFNLPITEHIDATWHSCTLTMLG